MGLTWFLEISIVGLGGVFVVEAESLLPSRLRLLEGDGDAVEFEVGVFSTVGVGVGEIVRVGVGELVVIVMVGVWVGADVGVEVGVEVSVGVAGAMTEMATELE